MENKINFRIFNQVVDEFFREMIEIFPEESKIKVNYSWFQTVYKPTSKKPCREFMAGAFEYIEKIAMKDELLFTGSGKDKPYMIDKMNIPKLWNSGISENTKECIWKYIKTLIKIGASVVEIPPEKCDLVNYIINS